MNVKLNKFILILLIIAAITSVIFLFIVESFNDISQDDLDFAMLFHKHSVWESMMLMYFSWQGRFMSFLLNGIQMKSYFLFGNMIPFAILIYLLNILLVSKALVNLFKLNFFESILFAIILFQLYVFSMFDLSSYFWMCTKSYTLFMSLSLFAFSELMINRESRWFNYLILFVTFAFLGCSYEIYAPIILLFMGLVLFFKFYQSNYNILQTIKYNKNLIFSFVVCLLFFTLMVIAPGNWVRMQVYKNDSNLSPKFFSIVSLQNSFQILKMLFLKIHYFILGSIILLFLFKNKKFSSKLDQRKFDLIKRIIVYSLLCIGFCLISILLNTFAVGSLLIFRAFNHINLIVFLLIGFSMYEFSDFKMIRKMTYKFFPIALLFVITFNIYCSFKNIPELISYKISVENRLRKLEELQIDGNIKTIKLKRLDIAKYHSVDDLWKHLIPFTSPYLLTPNDVFNKTDNYYNKLYRKYFQLSFDVITERED